MKKRISFLLVTALLVSTGLQAQSESKQINSIKRNKQYLYEEATEATEEEAYEAAREALFMRVKEYIETKKKYDDAENIIIKNINEHCERISMKRGELYRVFLYVSKKDIDAADNMEVLVKVKPDDASTDHADDGLQSSYEIIKNAVPPSTEEDTQIPPLEKAWQQEIVDKLCQMASATEARAWLARMKAEYKINRYGPIQECRKPDDAFVIIFNEGGKILAILGPGATQRANFLSKQYDTLANHSDANALYFMLAD